jgi:uncharacterized phosphosugar-binding protein
MSELPTEDGWGIDTYFRNLQEIQNRALSTQRDKLLKIAKQMAQIIGEGKHVYLFGTGHSHMLPEEAFCRAGGLAAAVPILLSALMLHEDIPLSAVLERSQGLSGPLLTRAKVQAGEMLFIFSNSGVNHCPVEMALEARKRGLTVVGVSSSAFADVAPKSPIGKRLSEVVDIALDNCGVPGDGLVAVGPSQWRAGPSSTIVGCLLWNSLVVECAHQMELLHRRAPIGASQNMPGAQEYNRQMRAEYEAAAKRGKST